MKPFISFHALAPACFSLASVAMSSCSGQAQTPTAAANLAPMIRQRPNVLLIVTDDQGAQASALGTPNISTPNMDKIAQQGALFLHAFCAYPSCSPSRASMLTGAYPQTTRVRINVPEYFGPNPPANFLKTIGESARWQALTVPDAIVTLPEALNGAGYFTGISHKFHVIPHSKFPFNEWLSGDPSSIKKFIGDAGNQPFFLMHNIAPPHRPASNYLRNSKHPLVDAKTLKLPPILPDTPTTRRDWAEYLTSVEIADDQVGEALAALRATGKADNTIVMFTGDHGPAFQRGKASVYPLGLAVPLMISGPGIQPGLVTKELASLVDLMPTILDFAGIAKPKTVQGISLRPLLERRPEAKGHDLLVGSHEGNPSPNSFKERGAFDGRYHYIRRTNLNSPRDINADNFDPRPWENLSYNATIRAKKQFPLQYQLMLEWEKGTKIEQLFDMDNDPWAINDVAKDPKYQTALETMRQALDKWQDANGDDLMPRSTALQPESGKPPVDDLQLRQAGPAPATMPAAGKAVEGWQPSGFARLTKHPDFLALTSTGIDPFLVFAPLPASQGPYVVELRMRSDLDNEGQLYWNTTAKPTFSPARMVPFVVQPDGQWHNYRIEIADQTLGSLRIDPGKKRGEVAFESIRVLDGAQKTVKEWQFKANDDS